MERNWEMHRRYRGSNKGTTDPNPMVRISKSGMSMNEAAYEAIGSPEYVVLMYDASTMVLGLRAARTDSNKGYVEGYKAVRTAKKIALNAHPALRHFGIIHNRIVYYDASMNNDILEIPIESGWAIGAFTKQEEVDEI